MLENRKNLWQGALSPLMELMQQESELFGVTMRILKIGWETEIKNLLVWKLDVHIFDLSH